MMTSRERVLAALNHQEPDRVPLCLGASGASVTDDVYFQLKSHYGIEGDVEPFRSGHGDNIYDPRVFDAMGLDFRHVFLRSSLAYKPVVDSEGGVINEWGVKVQKFGRFYEWISNPLADASISDLDSYPWPKPYEGQRDRGLQDITEEYFNETEFAIASRSPSRGFFDLGIQLRGFERFMMDLVLDKAFVHKLMGKLLEVICGFYDVLLDKVGHRIDIVETQDDYGHQNSLFFSPKTFREMIKPYRAELNQHIRSKAPQAKIYIHSCGAVKELIEDLIDCGVEVLNPVQPLAKGMDMDEMKSRFGKQITFHGSIDLQQALAGTPEDVEQEVKTRIKSLAPGGGFILSPANVVQDDVPIENIIFLFELAKKYGRYPLDIR
jgi:uroporphyrinogen decarboxylase